MKSPKIVPTQTQSKPVHARSPQPSEPPSNDARQNPQFRTLGREFANPVSYAHAYPSMARFAEALALRYDATRTRHAYYRQLRLIHEHFDCDPASVSEEQLREYFLFVKLEKGWQPKSIRQAAAAARCFYIQGLAHGDWTLLPHRSTHAIMTGSRTSSPATRSTGSSITSASVATALPSSSSTVAASAFANAWVPPSTMSSARRTNS